MGNKSNKVICFAPEHWGTLERFHHFYSKTYSFDKDTQKALSGTVNHFRKVETLLRIAKQHKPMLMEDRKQIEQYGYTPAYRSKELAALIESIIQTLYSSVDCTRKVVTFIYKGHRGVKQSTRKFFNAVANGNVADTVPMEIREAFAKAQWYNKFRKLRDALTHSDIGSCHLDEATQIVFYMHTSLEINNKTLIIDDIFNYVETLIGEVNMFNGKVFHFLNQTLQDEEISQICGIFNYRFYSRWVRPNEAVNFNSGRCDSFKWFEKDENPACPFAGTCQAYERRNREQSKAYD